MRRDDMSREAFEIVLYPLQISPGQEGIESQLRPKLSP